MIEQPSGTHLAQLNIGRLVADTDDPLVADFMNNIDRVNGAGKRMPGFVWMMESDGGAGNTSAKINNDPRLIPNLTVWENADSLQSFVFDTIHVKFMARRTEWFEKLEAAHFVMWFVPAGHRPTLDEALERLEDLRRNGPTDRAFGWAQLKRSAIA